MEFLCNFIIYGFIGWIIENVFCYYNNRHFQNDGFLNGPFKAMYAIAMSIILELYKFSPNIIILFIISAIIPTSVEYITGILMRKYFNKNYWNYYDEKYNYKGIICLKFSVAWIFLCITDVIIIQPYLIRPIYKLIVHIVPIIIITFIIVLTIDIIVTLIDFRDKQQIN